MSEGDDPRDGDDEMRDGAGADESPGGPTDEESSTDERSPNEPSPDTAAGGDTEETDDQPSSDDSPEESPAGDTNESATAQTDDTQAAETAGGNGDPGESNGAKRSPGGFRADAATQEDIDELRRELDELEEHVDDRTVHREDIEGDLKQYIRRRMRRGHATGWGPYLVLLYGTIMTLGAFVFLDGVWANLAMLVIWLSTLGLYTLMIIVGISITALRVPRGLLDRLRQFR